MPAHPRPRPSLLAAVLLAAAASQAAAAGATPVPIRFATPGEAVTAPDGASDAKRFRLGFRVVPSLLAAPPEAELRLSDWPAAPGERVEAILRRHEVYAPDARILIVDRRGVIEAPRSRQRFFWGHAAEDPEIRIFAAVDPRTGSVQGMTQGPGGVFELRPERGGLHVVAAAAAFQAPAGGKTGAEPAWSCGQEEMPQPLVADWEKRAAAPLWQAATEGLLTLSVAVDTDNELLALKFGDDTVGATDYLAQLFAAMNAIFERDLSLRLLQGTTYLRVASAADPYAATVQDTTYTKLTEFKANWRANLGGVERGLAMMISGKSPSAYSSAGLAWIDVLCSSTYGYSFTQVYRYSGSTAASDLQVVAHEIGHNLGSPHSHCYSPPIDQCWGTEGESCYAGAASCPAAATYNGVSGVRGTLMSYCHMLGKCGASPVLHPRTVELVAPRLQAQVGRCVFAPASAPAPTLAAVAPAAGPAAGGTQVTITGSGFAPGANVAIGGVAATEVVVEDDTRLTAVTGAHATGTVSVSVANPDGLAGTLSNSYFYEPTPAAGGDFYTLTPCRVLDTRLGDGGALAARAQRVFALGGRCGLPASARSVAANVTVTQPEAAGSVGSYPGNASPLGTNAVSFAAGGVRAAQSMLTLATDGTGTVGFHNPSAGAVHLIVDVVGYFD